jgi:hypothetical protein
MKPHHKPTILVLLLVVACLLAGLHPALADRDIVYSARYYLPPGSKGTSYFHLYRINPDGTRRTQITFGKHNDQNPTWSPNCRLIVFQRDSAIAVFDLKTVRIHTLRLISDKNWFYEGCAWSPDSKTAFVTGYAASAECAFIIPITGGKTQKLIGASEGEWSPDGLRFFTDGAKGEEILDLRTGKRISVEIPGQEETLPGYHSVIWLDNHSLAGVYEAPKDTHPHVALLRDDGTLKKKTPFSTAFGQTVGDSGSGSLMPPLLGGSEVTYVRDGSISTWTDYEYYPLNLKTGKTGSEFADGQFLAWSPDHRSFCSAPHRDLSFYEGKGSNERSVWTAPLQIGSRNSGNLRTITPGLVFVTGADWRKRSP